MKSLDPRVTRLPEVGEPGILPPKIPVDQFGTYEVFVKSRVDKPFQHEGSVHAPGLEMAFLLAKETFTRRFTCYSLCVAATQDVTVSAFSEGDQNANDLLPPCEPSSLPPQSYEIYHLQKRGKQHVFTGTVDAGTPLEALHMAREKINTGKPVFNSWAIPVKSFLITAPDEMDFWVTLPEKKFRDASDYKGGDRLKNFVDANPLP